ncbi:MAG: transposase [Candidatus Paceibacterota bacterium]
MYFSIQNKDLQEILHHKTIEIIAFCIMPNHFHILIKQLKDDGTSSYMHRVLGGYSRYYNNKYGTTGHIFQATYKSVLVKNNIQLLYLTAYIHRNPRSLSLWYGKELQYEWSSYQDYCGTNRFGELVLFSVILNQFHLKSAYYSFVESSPAKE